MKILSAYLWRFGITSTPVIIFRRELVLRGREVHVAIGPLRILFHINLRRVLRDKLLVDPLL